MTQNNRRPVQRTRSGAASRWVWPFGKNKGLRLDETPSDYLEWCAVNFADVELRDACRKELTRRAKAELSSAKPKRVSRRRRRDNLADEFAAIIGPNPKPQLWNPETRAIEPCPFEVGPVVVEEQERFKGVG